MKEAPTIFRLFCLVTAISMCIYCTYEFSRNKDLTEVSFEIFNEDEMSVYPQISFCYWDQFLDHELKKINKEFNSSSYSDFLKGELWDARMANVDIQKITPQLEDHVLDTCIQSSFYGKCENKGDISTHVHLFGMKCLSFHYRSPKRIFAASMWLNSSMILNNFEYTSLIVLSYPGQVFRGASTFLGKVFAWPNKKDSSNTYEMAFGVKDVEVIRRRNKGETKCVDWDKYDSLLEQQVLTYVGCRPFYLLSMESHRQCNTQQEMARIYKEFLENMVSSQDLMKFLPPCSEIQRMRAIYTETKINIEEEEKLYPGMDRKNKEGRGWFRITVNFDKNEFKEIKQVRAYSAQSLIGNAGGYVGLFVGYTIAELPALFDMLYTRLVGLLRYRSH